MISYRLLLCIKLKIKSYSDSWISRKEDPNTVKGSVMSSSLLVFEKNNTRILLTVDICTFLGVALDQLKIQLLIQTTEFLRKSQTAKLARRHP